MVQVVSVGNQEFEFPDNMSQEKMKAALDQHFNGENMASNNSLSQSIKNELSKVGHLGSRIGS